MSFSYSDNFRYDCESIFQVCLTSWSCNWDRNRESLCLLKNDNSYSLSQHICIALMSISVKQNVPREIARVMGSMNDAVQVHGAAMPKKSRHRQKSVAICQSLSFPSQPSTATCFYLADIVAGRRSEFSKKRSQSEACERFFLEKYSGWMRKNE